MDTVAGFYPRDISNIHIPKGKTAEREEGISLGGLLAHFGKINSETMKNNI